MSNQTEVEGSGVPAAPPPDADVAECIERNGVESGGKKKRRRGSKAQYVFETENGTAWGPLAQYAQTREDVDCLLMQELHLLPARVAAEEGWLRARRWRGALGSATQSAEGGWQGGVGLAVRGAYGLCLFPGQHQAEVVPARAAAAHFGGFVKGGIAIVTIYLWTSEGLSARNMEVLDAVGSFVRGLGVPYIIGGDWNLHPHALEASGWVRRLKGRVVAPAGPTFVPTAGQSHNGSVQQSSKIDYFVIAEALSGYVKEIRTVDTPRIAQHLPVRLVMTSAQTKPTMRVLRKKFKPGPDRVYGPARQSPELGRLRNEFALAKGTVGSSHAPTHAGGASRLQLETMAGLWLRGLECEVAAHHDLSDLQLSSFFGRDQGPRFATVNALAPVAFGYPRTSQQGKEWRQLSRRLRALVHVIGVHIEDECRPEYDRLRSIHYLRHKIAATAGVIRQSPHWQPFAGRLREVRNTDCWDLLAWADEANQLAHSEELASERERRQGWKTWLKQALANGAKAAHAWTRGPTGWQPSMTEEGPEEACQGDQDPALRPPLDDQGTADQLLTIWTKIWGAHNLNPGELQYLAQYEELPRLEVRAVRDAAASIKLGTAIGADSVDPRWMLWVSDE